MKPEAKFRAVLQYILSNDFILIVINEFLTGRCGFMSWLLLSISRIAVRPYLLKCQT